MKDKKLHMIGYAHIDPVWLWQWQEGFQEVKATFRSALDRMKEYPDFYFTFSSAAFFEWVEKNDPAMFAEIQQRVKEGRWQLVSGWWIQPDCNLPSGESFVRQGLYGQRYFQEKFGTMSTVGYNPDSFGHHAMLPQILKKSGMDYYIFMRPGPHEKGLPGRLFQWESDDGSRVLTYRIPFEYLTGPEEITSHVVRVAAECKEPFTDLMCWYGVGNHGGGPTKLNIESLKRLNATEGYPTLVMSTPDRFFQEIAGKDLPFPVVHDELQHHASGCYAAHSGIKKWNRQGENMLTTAEKLSAIALRTTGQPYPADYHLGWKNVLFNQFHDILAGTSLEVAYDDARDLHGEAMSIGARGLNYAMQSIAWKINIPAEQGMKPVVVFNPHAWPVKANVELEIGCKDQPYVMLDDQGNEIPWQFVRSFATVSGWRKRLSFSAELPSMGYRVYRLLPGAGAASFTTVDGTDTVLENSRFRLEFDPETGCIASLLDKKLNFNVFKGQAAKPVVIEDKSDTWSHGVLHYNNVVGQFKATRVRRIEHGPARSTIRVESEYGKSTLTQDFTMYPDRDQIDVAVTVDWHEQFKMLKLRFPTGLHFPKATYEIPYGHIERPVNGEEEACQNWVDLSGVIRGPWTPYGVSLLNDGKYSFDVRETEMSLTVLRSPIYAHHDPYVPTSEGRYVFMDQGVQRFTYAILAHEGGWEKAETAKRGWELNQRPVALVETYHEGPLPQQDSFVQVDKGNVLVSVIKKAEDNDDLIIRAYEVEKVGTVATISLPKWNRTIEAKFGPCEIKTFRIPADASKPVTETNLLEF